MMLKKFIGFILGFLISILFFSVGVSVLFLNPPHILFYVFFVLIVTPLVAIAAPIVLSIKRWKKNRAFAVGIIVGEIFLLLVGISFIIQIGPALHH